MDREESQGNRASLFGNRSREEEDIKGGGLVPNQVIEEDDSDDEENNHNQDAHNVSTISNAVDHDPPFQKATAQASFASKRRSSTARHRQSSVRLLDRMKHTKTVVILVFALQLPSMSHGHPYRYVQYSRTIGGALRSKQLTWSPGVSFSTMDQWHGTCLALCRGDGDYSSTGIVHILYISLSKTSRMGGESRAGETPSINAEEHADY